MIIHILISWVILMFSVSTVLVNKPVYGAVGQYYWTKVDMGNDQVWIWKGSSKSFCSFCIFKYKPKLYVIYLECIFASYSWHLQPKSGNQSVSYRKTVLQGAIQLKSSCTTTNLHLKQTMFIFNYNYNFI